MRRYFSFSKTMKIKLVFSLLVAACGAVLSVRAADEPKPAAPVKAPLDVETAVLLEKIKAKASTGAVTEAALADELKTFDRLLAEHKGDKSDAVAQVLILKAVVYLQLIGDLDKAEAAFRQLKTEMPESSQAKEVDQALEAIAKQKAAQRIQDAMKVGTPFPDFAEKDLAGEPLSVGKFKGSVVFVDFWATWCGPCVEEMPRIIELYKKYHARGLEIVGVSLDREESALKEFIAQRKMTWPQFYDGKFWENKLAVQYGVLRIPFNVLVDGEGRIVARDLHGAELEAAVAKLLGP